MEVGSIGGQQDLLNFTGNLKIAVEGVLLSRCKVDGLIKEGESRLLQDGLEEFELRFAERVLRGIPSDSEHAQKFLTVVERADHQRPEPLGPECFRNILLPSQKARPFPCAGLAKQASADAGCVEAQETFRSSGRALARGKIGRKRHERGASFGEEGREEILARSIRKIEGSSVPFQDVFCPFDDQSVKFAGGNALGEGCSQTMEKIKDPFLFLMDFGRAPLELADPSSGAEDHEAKDDHGQRQDSDDRGLEWFKGHGQKACTGRLKIASLGHLPSNPRGKTVAEIVGLGNSLAFRGLGWSLFQVLEDIFEAGGIGGIRGDQGLMGREHNGLLVT